MGIHGSGHGDGAAVVLQAVVSLVLDGGRGVLLLHSGSEAAALDHEAGDDTVEDCIIVKAVIDVLQEVGNRFRSLVRIKLHKDVAGSRFQQHNRIFRHDISFLDAASSHRPHAFSYRLFLRYAGRLDNTRRCGRDVTCPASCLR